MSLYNHIDGKDALVDAMVEHVAAEIERPDPDLAWKEAVRALAIATRAVLRRHPWAVELWNACMPGPQRLGLVEAMLRLLASAEFPDDLNDLAFHAIVNHVLGHSRQEQGTALMRGPSHREDGPGIPREPIADGPAQVGADLLDLPGHPVSARTHRVHVAGRQPHRVSTARRRRSPRRWSNG